MFPLQLSWVKYSHCSGTYVWSGSLLDVSLVTVQETLVQEEILRHSQNTLHRSHLSAGRGKPRHPPRAVDGRVWKE